LFLNGNVNSLNDFDNASLEQRLEMGSWDVEPTYSVEVGGTCDGIFGGDCDTKIKAEAGVMVSF
jgi:hypothetical protein